MPWPAESDLTDDERALRDLLDRFAYRDEKASEIEEALDRVAESKIKDEVVHFLLEKRQNLLDEIYDLALQLTPRS